MSAQWLDTYCTLAALVLFGVSWFAPGTAARWLLVVGWAVLLVGWCCGVLGRRQAHREKSRAWWYDEGDPRNN